MHGFLVLFELNLHFCKSFEMTFRFIEVKWVRGFIRRRFWWVLLSG